MSCLLSRVLPALWILLLGWLPMGQGHAQGAPAKSRAAVACPTDVASLRDIIHRQGVQFDDLGKSRGVRLPGEPELDNINWLLKSLPGRILIILGEHQGRSCAWVWTTRSNESARQVVGVQLADSEPAKALDLSSLARLNLPGRAARAVVDVPPRKTIDQVFVQLQKRWVPPALLAALADAREIALLPTGALAQLPWNALLLAAQGFRGDLPAVTVAASLTTALGDHRRRILKWSPIDETDKVLVVGNPDYQGALPQLPGAEAEARALAQTFKVEALIGAQATTEKVIQGLQQSSVAFLATHGFSSTQSGLEGGALALTGGRLNAREIQSLKLEKSPLIVLSACETGLGQIHEAGTIGLARAFQIAGASGVVMSLWSVDDEATQKLMLHFVEELRTSAPPQALMRAQIRLRQTHPDPRHWGAFNYFGSPIGFGP